jgi:hypothetical protein
MNTLNDLLNQKVIGNPEQWFESVCNILFYRTIFHIEGQRYKITEAELYLHSKEHPDIFTHKSDVQEKRGLFYFHKRGGKRGGVDITFGNENRFGGILLRGMQNIDPEKESDYIDGPGLLSQRIMEIFKEKGSKVNVVVPKLDINIFHDQDLWLEEISGDDQVIYKAPRVGLNLSKDVENHLAYFTKLYRYLAGPAPLKTTKW